MAKIIINIIVYEDKVSWFIDFYNNIVTSFLGITKNLVCTYLVCRL